MRRLVPVLAVGLVVLTACSDADTATGERTPAEVMELAKTTLDETSGVAITMTGEDLPEGVTAIRAAEGVGTHAPAFDGTLTVVLAGTDFEVPVVAVDGTVYAQIPLTPGWSDVDPAEYGAPDPAGLMSTEEGLSSLLPATTDLEAGESVRGGEDNREVLTEYTGTVPGDVVGNVIPSASGDFDATYTVTDEGELRSARLTGVFYPDTEPMTYVIDFDDYGTEQDITAP
ncbi:LppX_LprAFG lipoprotein [Nocardioides euryhalodurans]|uniref:LppX_LprAFG lipoprotein n=1 Tax=Nocardioides euryhalodurans TaxID=2518370 RepID=A0A4P7GH05_9ACTN|nr:LppX_LprAFG lipoprotein [Nocardioides euryhalodurans]QBR90929.1 LppX_LprAFG lipoprotein [Nocardioides euryhalodurans]